MQNSGWKDVQVSQFTNRACTGVLKRENFQISMDGCGRWMDHVLVELWWRSVKYKEVYLKAYDNGVQAQGSLPQYFRFYNAVRKHQAMDRQPRIRRIIKICRIRRRRGIGSLSLKNHCGLSK